MPENFMLEIVGSGPEEENLKKLASELKLGERVKFVSEVFQIENGPEITVLTRYNEKLSL